MSLKDWQQKQYRDLRAIAEDERGRLKRRAGRVHLAALEIPMSVIVGVVLGNAVDERFHVAPIGITVGLLAGVGAAVNAIARIIAWQKRESLQEAQSAQPITQAAPARDDSGGDGGGQHDPPV
jgi:F0F1-type ATP synthase assembly protein I